MENGIIIISKRMKSISHSSFSSSPLPAQGHKGSLRYKENVSALFQKLNALQSASEVQKSQSNSQLVSEFNQKESQAFDSSKLKANQFKAILRTVAGIEKEMENQKNEQEKLSRNVKQMIDDASRHLDLSFERMEKQRLRSENSLQQWIQGKIESFLLKNKSAWKQEPLVSLNAVLEQISFLHKDHENFIDNYGKQLARLRKQTTASLQELLKAAQEEAAHDYEVEVSSFMKTIHAEASQKLKGLEEQRAQTEERVLRVLERVTLSCTPPLRQ